MLWCTSFEEICGALNYDSIPERIFLSYFPTAFIVSFLYKRIHIRLFTCAEYIGNLNKLHFMGQWNILMIGFIYLQRKSNCTAQKLPKDLRYEDQIPFKYGFAYLQSFTHVYLSITIVFDLKGNCYVLNYVSCFSFYGSCIKCLD